MLVHLSSLTAIKFSFTKGVKHMYLAGKRLQANEAEYFIVNGENDAKDTP